MNHQQRVTLTEGGATECETVLQKSLYDPKDAWLPFINNALKAKELLKRDITYLVSAHGRRYVLYDYS